MLDNRNEEHQSMDTESEVLQQLQGLLVDFEPIVEEDFSTVGDATDILLGRCPPCTRCKVTPEPEEVVKIAT